MAPPTPRSQRHLHNFVLPTDFKWFTKSQTKNNPPPRRRWRPSTSRRQPPWADDVPAAVAAAEQKSPPKASTIAAGMNENISNPSPGGSSSGKSYHGMSGEPTTDSVAIIFKATASPQKPLRIKFTSSKSGTSSKSSVSSSRRGSSSSGGIPHPPVCFNAMDKELCCIDLLNKGFQAENDNTADSGKVSLNPEKMMIEQPIQTLSAVAMDIDQDKHKNEGPKAETIPEDIKGKKESEEKEPRLLINKGKKEEKPIRTYVRGLRKKLAEQEKRLEKVLQKKVKDEEYKPDPPTDVNSNDLNAKIWNLRTRKPDRKAEALNLDKKRVGSSSKKDEGQPVKEQKDKQVAEGGEGKSGDGKANAEANKKKDKGKESHLRLL